MQKDKEPKHPSKPTAEWLSQRSHHNPILWNNPRDIETRHPSNVTELRSSLKRDAQKFLLLNVIDQDL